MAIEKKTPWRKTTKIHPVLVGRFSTNMKRIREQKGWTHDAFAKVAKITGPYVSLLEAQERTPSLHMVERIAWALGVDPGDLLREVK
jgi:transcriptional regulator with XRE-family HTH domain